jgi:hypothetical protein
MCVSEAAVQINGSVVETGLLILQIWQHISDLLVTKKLQKSTENIDGTINKTPGLRTNSIIDKCARIFLIFID